MNGVCACVCVCVLNANSQHLLSCPETLSDFYPVGREPLEAGQGDEKRWCWKIAMQN